MAREKKVSIKYFENKKIKSPGKSGFLYLRLRYDNIQAEIPSLSLGMYAQRIGLYDIPNDDIDGTIEYNSAGEMQFNVDRLDLDPIEKSKYLKEEKDAVQRIIESYLSQGINIIGNKPKNYVQLNFTSLFYAVNEYSGIQLVKSIHNSNYSKLGQIISLDVSLSTAFDALQEISSDDFKTKILEDYKLLRDVVDLLRKLNTDDRVLRIYHWRLQKDDTLNFLMKLSPAFRDRNIIETIDNAVNFNLSRLEFV